MRRPLFAQRWFRSSVVAGLWAVGVLLPALSLAHDFTLWGRDMSFDATATVGYERRGDNDGNPKDSPEDDNFHYLFSSLNLALSSGRFRLGGRFDLHSYFDTYFESQTCRSRPRAAGCNQRELRFKNQYFLYRERFRFDDPNIPGLGIVPERFYLIYTDAHLDVTMGDFYVSFGRGLALNMIKLDDLGQDTTVRGGKFVLRHSGLELTLVGGVVNPLDIDSATGFVAPWPAEPLLAARAEYNLLETVQLGVHGVLRLRDGADLVQSNKARTAQDDIVGVTLEAPALLDGNLSIGSEVDIQRTVLPGCVVRGFGEEEACSSRQDWHHPVRGLAAYLTSTYTLLDDYTFNLEAKYYSDYGLQAPSLPFEPYQLVYAQPPTLERLWAVVSDNQNAAGARLRIDYNAGEIGPFLLIIYANYALTRSWTRELHQVHDPYGGFELQWQDGIAHWNLLSGLRWEQNLTTHKKYRHDIHVFGDIEQPVTLRHSIKLNYFMRNRVVLSEGGTPAKWTEGDFSLGYKWAAGYTGFAAISIAGTFELSGDPGVVAFDPVTKSTPTRYYFGGSIRYFITNDTYVNVRFGENRPGLKCFNGVCRTYPAFSGAQVVAVGRI